MSSFYMYSYASIPPTPPAGMWYASWTTSNQSVQWTQNKPALEPDGQTSWVVGVVAQESCPTGATTLSDSGGDKSLPPRPDLITASSIDTFKTQFSEWTVSLKTVDLSE